MFHLLMVYRELFLIDAFLDPKFVRGTHIVALFFDEDIRSNDNGALIASSSMSQHYFLSSVAGFELVITGS